MNLLWTGGWDSTFRLLNLVVALKKVVQPHYMIDSARLSTGAEIRAMARIKGRLLAEHPEARGLLLPTIFRDASDISDHSAVTEAFNRIVRRTFAGTQYDFLARLCRQFGIGDMELCIHKDDKAHTILEPFVTRAQGSGDACIRLDSRHEGTDEHLVFQCFKFPLFDVTKVQMDRLSADRGWKSLMDMTWFCHRPRAGNRPCGLCHPCVYTMQEGLSRRLPLSSRLRYHLRIAPRVGRILWGHPRMYALAQKLQQRLRRK